MKISATNKATGEVIEWPANTPEQLVEAWVLAKEYERLALSLKDQLKKLVPSLVGDRGTSEPISNYMFRVSTVQRMNYDKSVMREVLDPDVFDVLLKPDKPAVDKYIKENLETLLDGSTRLRKAMVAEGKPYQVIKLERLSDDEAQNKNDTGLQLADSK